MSRRKPPLSETELEVLKVLWQEGPGTVRELNELLARRGRRWAYTTVLTLLARLENKGYVASDKSGLAHVFRPVVSRDQLLRQRLTHLADDLCDGTAAPLVQALVSGRRFSPEEIEHFRQLLDRLAERKKNAEP
ncbi:MAG TPA: BlaI/MecI/CopY family transcriptional regulator [Pirellulales bacterium]|jgi:predicted transcriptional regulator|nr:BlaI/MecI/CopY family transcriptional regulator [Pirellulales bacterium]